MHTTRRASLLTFCIALLLVIGACSGGGTPVTANPGPDLSKYQASVEGAIYQNGGPVTSGRVFVYDLANQKLFYEAAIGSDGKYAAGVDAGQYLVFPVSPAGWRAPSIESDFSNYVNVESDKHYRMDIELTDNIPAGEQLAFGFVSSSTNNKPVGGAKVSAGSKSTTTDGYGFYAFTVPSGTTTYTITAQGFFDLHKDTREAQVTADFFKTPFFKMNPTTQTGASIGGIIRDVGTGKGLGGARVTLARPEDPNFIPVRFLTNLGGEYRFYNLTDGIYKLYFERPGYVSGYREGLVVKPNDEVILNVFMNPDNQAQSSIWGYVNNAALPVPIGGARVTASNPLLGSYTTNTQPSGYYLLDNVISTNYTITIVAPSSGGTTFYESTSTFQTIAPGANRLDFNLRFIDEGVLRGNIIVEGGIGGPAALPATGVEVTAEKVGGSLSGVKFKTSSDGKGQFTFNGLPMGNYIVKGTITFSPTEVFYGEQTGVPVSSGTTTNIDLTLTQQ